jgi:hypothetical protein
VRLLYAMGAVMAGTLLAACATSAAQTSDSDSHPVGGRATGTVGVAIRRPDSTPPAHAASSRSAAPGKPSFPPKTPADFRAFAATGNAGQVHQIGTGTEGLPSCPAPNIYVTVSLRLRGRKLEADLSAFFLQKGLMGSQCQAFVFAFHSRSDYRAHQNDGYTAGRVALTNSAGSQHNLEVDAGGVTSMLSNPQFNFNF